MNWKTFNKIFTQTQYRIHMLKCYLNQMMVSLKHDCIDHDEYVQELEQDYKAKNLEFPEKQWNEHRKIYDEIYPTYFYNSFMISACALFEDQMNEICNLVKDEHKMPLYWDTLEGSVPFRLRKYLGLAGISLKDAPANWNDTWMASNTDKKFLTVKDLWNELENYFRVRNCLAHHGGVISKMRYPDTLMRYCKNKDLYKDRGGKFEIVLNADFNREVCDTFQKFVERLLGAYYSVPLPD